MMIGVRIDPISGEYSIICLEQRSGRKRLRFGDRVE
jgi:hypothetical protein